MFRLCQDKQKRMISMKEIIGDTLVDMVKEDDRVLAFDADLASPGGFSKLGEIFPEKLINCGIQESNMVGAAAASSDSGAIPFAHTFAAFAGRKCLDQIFMAACYPGMNFKFIGSDPGITAAFNGGSHQAYEDMGSMICFNNITLLEPSDGIMCRELLKMMKDTYGVFYLRSNRKETHQIYSEGSKFEFGKGNILSEGKDVTIIASGIEVVQAQNAANELAKEGVFATVIDMFCWRPLDKTLIKTCAEKTGAIVVAENHNTANGLGAAVAKAVGELCPVPLGFIGVDERYGEVGSIPFLMKKFSMDSNSIVSRVHETIRRKSR